MYVWMLYLGIEMYVGVYYKLGRMYWIIYTYIIHTSKESYNYLLQIK